MKNTGKIAVWSLVGIVILAGAYYSFRKLRWTKEKAIDYLSEKSEGFNRNMAMNMGEKYLIARAKAFAKGDKDFDVEGRLFDTKTGKELAKPKLT